MMDWKEKVLDVLKKLMITFLIICKRNNCMRSSCCDTTIIISPHSTPSNTPELKRRHSL